jgi:NAD+ kinase
MKKIERVLVVGNARLRGVKKLSERVAAYLKPYVRKVRTVLEQRDFSRVRADLVVILGGDGSILNVASRMGKNQIPVVGIQMGRLGFLSELTPSDCEENLLKIVTGNASVEERMMISCTVRRGGKISFSGTALNDAVLKSRSLSRMVLLEMRVAGDYVTTFHGDGVIIATPVGSTAHSLSAGGPIVEPGMNSYVINPICSHALTSRPLVISAGRSLEFASKNRRNPIALTLDGQRMHRFEGGDKLFVKKSPHSFLLVKVTGRSYFETLRLKFNWAGTSLDNGEAGRED